MQGRVNMAGALAVVGAGGLLVGLSLNWYEPEISAWTAFEIVDLLLAAIAAGVVVVALSRSVERPRLEAAADWLPAAALAALALVVASIVNHPPAAVDRSLEIGAWVSLGGAILLVIAAILATTEVSVVVTMRPRQRERAAGAGASQAAEEEGWEESPFDEPPTDEEPIEPGEDELSGSVEEGIPPADEADTESETRSLSPRPED